MMANNSTLVHPGSYVRENILSPRKVTVTAASKLLGISRPGVSNFLNGKVSATPDMAARLERAFGVPAKTILDLQTAYDAHTEKTMDAAQKARTYVPPFLNIQANDLEDWFTRNISARAKLAVLLRILVHSTGRDLREVDFPGNDDAQRPGWDGFIKANTGTPWIPSGLSGWEFGVTGDIKGKADGDFAKSVKATATDDRAKTSFVFVTPRRWPGKTAWVTAMKAKNIWKDVRAYDSSDLEQWMEQSPAAQTWFANQTARLSDGVRTLERCWNDWANVAAPPLHSALFATAIVAWGERIKSFLAKIGSDPLTIMADSVEEALAFLSQVLATPELEQYKDRVLIFDQPGVLPKLAQGATDFIAVTHTREVEREFGPYSTSLRTIVVYPRNAVNTQPNIILEPLGSEAFTKALEAMGKTHDEIVRLANASGRSLTVLRRILSNLPAIHTPVWAAEHKTSSGLVPFVLVGAWDAQNAADQTVLSLLAGDRQYDVLEKRISELLCLNDSPVWSIGGYRGVVSKIDSLFAIAGAITKADLERFLGIARMILSEDDPALDLPEKDRWAAAIYGKQRELSGAVREGISETLILLAVHGKKLFGERLVFDGEREVAKLVHDLLEPVTLRKLEANEHDLPLYAEAAPGEFLDIIERDLRAEKPEIMGLLRPADTGVFAACPRTGLLWALEGLAWNPATFPRVVKILAQLSGVEINDNWANKPIASLGSIFRTWMPQTAADHETRLKAIHMLMEKHPSVGWELCLQQFGEHHSIGNYNYKPKWRPDGYGFGAPVETWEPIRAFVREMVKSALTRPSYTTEMLCDLISKLHALPPEDQERVWGIIDEWRTTCAADEDIAKLREKIRVEVLTRRRRKNAAEENWASLTKKARAVYAAMQPQDIVNKHEWLFRQSWIKESADELFQEEMDFEAREQRVKKLRVEALTEIVRERGTSGIFALAEKGHSQYQIGMHIASGILNAGQIEDMILQCLRSGRDNAGRNNIIAGMLTTVADDRRKAIYSNLRGKITDEEVLSLLLLSPYGASTWAIVDQFSEKMRTRYWGEVVPHHVSGSPEENNESIRRLLAVKRPRAAFVSVDFMLEKIRPSLLVQMLSAMTMGGNDKPDEYLLRDHSVRRAFQLLEQNPDVSSVEKAGLEFAYIDVLTHPFRDGEESPIPNLERYLEEHPEMFVQAVVWAYKRKDRGEDPPEFRTAEGREHLAKRGHRLLQAIKRLPGQDMATEDERREKLAAWVVAVRKSCAELDRAKIADHCLGEFFSRAPAGRDGVWPNAVIRDMMEDLQSEDISQGAYMGLYNARGAHMRAEGGGQERELADKYRNWAESLQYTHPFVSSSLLMAMVKTYEREAEQHDTEAGIQRRLRH